MLTLPVLTAALFGLVFVIGGSWSASSAASPSVPTPQHPIVGKPITLPRALFEANAPGGSLLVTTDEAREAEEAMWKAWERAMIDNDTRALEQLIAPGQVLKGTLYNCAFPVGLCAPEKHVRPIRSLITIVPIQHTYPIYFLSEIQTIEQVQNGQGLTSWHPWIELQILTKATPSSSWMLSFDSGYNLANGSTPLPLPLVQGQIHNYSNGGYGILQQEPAQPPTPPYPAAQYLSLLAAYWQSYFTSGHPPNPSPFVADGFTSGFGQELAQFPQGSAYVGHREYKSFSTEPTSPTWSFIEQGGDPLVCGSVIETATDVAIGSDYMNQNADESNFGIPLAPGQYRQIVSQTAHDTCIYAVQGSLDAAGNNTFTYGITGSLVSNASPQAGSSTLSDLKTAYGVLVYELGEYQKNLNTCERKGRSSCLDAVNSQLSDQFGQFASSLMSYKFSPAEQQTADSLYATAAKLSGLFQDAHTHPGDLGRDSRQINDEVVRFDQESTTLFQQLS